MQSGREQLNLQAALANQSLTRIHTVQEHNRGLPVLDGAIVVAGGKPPVMDTFKLAGRDVAITRMHVPDRFTGYIVPDPRWIVIHVPLSWDGEYRFNGQLLRTGDALIFADPNGYYTRGMNRDALTLGVRRSALGRAMRALTACEVEVPTSLTVRFSASARLLQVVAAQIAAVEAARGPSSAHVLHLLPDEIEAHVLDVLALECISALRSLPPNEGSRRRAVDVVALATEMTVRSDGAVPSLTELCAATGVGQTRLFECFHEVHGLAPGAFLQALRLYRSFVWLSDAHNPVKSVKQVALGSGFTKAGRFAEYFRAQYGELPSAVLARTRAMRGDQ